MKWTCLIAIAATTHLAAAQTLPVPVVHSCTPVPLASPSKYTLQTVLYETTADGQQEYLDLYTPIGIAKPTMAMYIHGGGFVGGDKEEGNGAAVPRRLVSLGWQVASINYRLAGANGFANLFPNQLRDAVCALHWLKTNGLGDDKHIVVMGDSAGGGIASWVGTIARSNAPAFLSSTCLSSYGAVDEVAGIASYYGFSDFANTAAYFSRENIDFWDRTVFDFTVVQRPEALAAASPVNHVDSRGPAFFLTNGLADTIVDPVQTTEFAKATIAAGVPTNVVQMPGIGHNFHPFSPLLPEISCTLAAWLKAIQALPPH